MTTAQSDRTNAPSGRTDAKPPHNNAIGFWTLTVLLSLILAAAGAAITADLVSLRPAVYRSTAVLAIAQPLAQVKAPDAGIFGKLVALRFEYAEIATTQLFADFVAPGTGVSANTLHDDVFTAVPPDSLLFEIGAQSSSPETARTVANVEATGVVSYVQHEMMQLDIPTRQQVQVNVDSPADQSVQISPTRQRELGSGGFVGVVIFALGLGIQTLRRRG